MKQLFWMDRTSQPLLDAHLILLMIFSQDVVVAKRKLREHPFGSGGVVQEIENAWIYFKYRSLYFLQINTTLIYVANEITLLHGERIIIVSQDES